MDRKEKTAEPFVWVEEYTNFEWQQQYQQPNPSTRKRKKMEFRGWASRPLIHFLNSIGRDTTNPISQIDVTAIVNEYVDQNLLQPEPTSFYHQSAIKSKSKKKKKRVLCDERLRALFGRKSISRVMIYKLIERHLAEANQIFDSDDSHDYLSCGNDDEEDNAGGEANSKHRKNPKSLSVIVEMGTPKSCFAAVIPENIKLVYLRRSLVEEIIKEENSNVPLEMKIIGSFVRIKSDPNDCLQKHSHHLLQVSGLKNCVKEGDDGTKILLHASGVIKDIPIGVLSDEDFSEEECDDLRQKMKDGVLKRLTVEELQEKARLLHEQMIKHFLARELALLQNLIDRANEKGWRRELFEYLERKELLQTQEEQLRLLSELPEIVAEEIEPEATTPYCPDEVEQGNDIPTEPIHEGPMEAPSDDNSNDGFELTWAGYSSEETQHDGLSEDKGLENSTTERHGMSETQNVSEVITETPRRVIEQEVIDLSDDEETELVILKVPTSISTLEEAVWHYVDPQGDAQGPFPLASLKRWSEADYFPPDFRIWRTGQIPNEAVYLKDILSMVLAISGKN